MKLRLYHYWRSSSSWRVRWALALKGLPCEMIAVDLLSGESESQAHLSRNPLGYVPVLEIVGDKPRLLTESVAIIEWLEEVHPAPALLPADAFDRARIRQLCEIINAATQPLANPNVTDEHSSDAAEKKRWNQLWIRRGLHAYEALAREKAGRFTFGDTLSMADLFLVPQCYNALRSEIALEREFPLLARIDANCLATPSCQAAHPDRYKPA